MVALRLPPLYVAVAKILVDSSRISADLARPTVPGGVIQQLEVLEQQLTTRDSLLAMAEKFAIYPSDHGAAGEIVDDMRQITKIEPIEFGERSSGNGAIAFAISFEAGDPVLAANVANAFAAAIVDTNARERKARAADARDFLDREVDRLQAALDAAQD